MSDPASAILMIGGTGLIGRDVVANAGPHRMTLLGRRLPELPDPGHPSARLRRRQQMIMRRMGAVTPPPVIAEPALPPVADPNPNLPLALPELPLPTVPVLPPKDSGSGTGTGRGPGQ